MSDPQKVVDVTAEDGSWESLVQVIVEDGDLKDPRYVTATEGCADDASLAGHLHNFFSAAGLYLGGPSGQLRPAGRARPRLVGSPVCCASLASAARRRP